MTATSSGRPASPAKSNGSANLSVVVITLNEEGRIAQCLGSLPRGAELIVLDSGSTDRTCEIARSCGARVVTRPFTTYGEQKNAALALATREWILSLDADEVMSPELARAVATVAAADAAKKAYRVRRRLVFMGRRLRFGRAADRPVRMIRRGRGRFEADIHERLVAQDPVEQLDGELLHYSYDDLSHYLRTFDDYTTRIAANHARLGHAMPALPLHVLRPWTEFFYRYVIRLGFLDGYAGYTYALLSSLYTYVKYAKLKERLCASGTSAPTAGTAPSPNTP